MDMLYLTELHHHLGFKKKKKPANLKSQTLRPRKIQFRLMDVHSQFTEIYLCLPPPPPPPSGFGSPPLGAPIMCLPPPLPSKFGPGRPPKRRSLMETNQI